MDYKELYKFWLKEKASSSLLEIPADFYISMNGKLTKLYQKTQNLEWEELADEIIERMEFLRQDIAQLRLSKILNSVIYNIPIELGHTTWGERRLIKDLRNSIEMIGMEKPNILDTQENLAITNLQNDSDEESSQIEENRDAIPPSTSNLTIKILDDVEAFIGLDEKRYGPLIRHDVVHLPVENAKALIARGMARLIETEIKNKLR
ncbi:MAG: DNA replication complex subunit Gins51 [Candidatus Hodarchaeales archaeon]